MPSADPDRARSRLITATRQILAGLEQQRTRILGSAEAAPKVLEGTSAEFTDLTASRRTISSTTYSSSVGFATRHLR